MTGPRFLDGSTTGRLPGSVDVLIVGSGLVGSTYARIVAERAPRARILVVEAGPRLTRVAGVHVRNIADAEQQARAVRLSEGPDTDGDRATLTAHFDTTATGPAAAAGTFLVNPPAAGHHPGSPLPAAAMSRNVGGMGSHWATATPSPRGRERIGFIPEDDWARALAMGRRLLAVNDQPLVDTAEWQECLARLGGEFKADLPEDGQVRDMPLARQSTPDGHVYWTGGDVVLGDLAAQPRETFAIAADTLCRELLAEHGKVGGAVLENRVSGQTTRVSARVVVVAGDSLHTPQLLWASGIRPRALGRYLNDHMMVGALITPEYLDTPADPSVLYSARRTLNNVTGAPSSGMGWVPYSDDVHPLHGQFGQTVVYPEDGGRGVGLVMFGYMFAKQARFADRVWFSADELDAYGMPAIRFDYGFTAHDLELRDLATRMMARIGAALGVADPPITTQPDGMSLHYLGSTRMGESDDGESVCDSYSRVWGYRNLYVGGNGVIPTPLSANPTLTSVSLAARAAEQVAGLVESVR